MTTVPEPTDTTQDRYQLLADTLREIADRFVGLAGRGLAEPVVSVSVQTHCPDTIEGDPQKIAFIDAVGQALLSQTGSFHKMSSGGYHYNVSGFIGPVRVSAFDSITPPQERAKDEEIARLRAELAKVTGADEPSPAEVAEAVLAS